MCLSMESYVYLRLHTQVHLLRAEVTKGLVGGISIEELAM